MTTPNTHFRASINLELVPLAHLNPTRENAMVFLTKLLAEGARTAFHEDVMIQSFRVVDVHPAEHPPSGVVGKACKYCQSTLKWDPCCDAEADIRQLQAELHQQQSRLKLLSEQREAAELELDKLLKPERHVLAFHDGKGWRLDSPVFHAVVETAAQIITQADAPNYVELDMPHPDYGSLILNIQKRDGKSAHALRQAAEAESVNLRLLVEAIAADPYACSDIVEMTRPYKKETHAQV